MSLNGFKGQHGRPVGRPAADRSQGAPAQPTWHAQDHQDHQQVPNWPQPGGLQPYPQQHGSPQAQQGYAQPAPYGAGQGLSADAYAPHFQPYNPAGHQYGGQGAQAHDQAQPLPAHQPAQSGHYPPSAYGVPPAAPPQWAPPQGASPIGQQAGYRAAEMRHPEMEPHFSDWNQGYGGQQAAPGGYDYGDPQGYEAQQMHADQYGDMGFAQAQGGELEQAYAEDDDEDYEYEDAGRGRRPMMIAAALAGAIFVGGSMAYGYKALFGGGPSGTPPVVKSADLPNKTKPADAGGKLFAHVDSKVMGRLGDGSGSSPSSDLDANGTRKVSTLVVGRDGSIQAPPSEPVSEPAADSSSPVAVPGLMVVDAMDSKNSRDEAPSNSAPSAPQKVVVTPPPEPETKPATVAKAQVLNSPEKASSETGSIEEKASAPAKAPAPKKVAALAPADVSDAQPPVSSGSGYVAVLASVPKSQTSRMDALARFADLQQKYSAVLAGKTPDVAEANLGAKGDYHRLVVGPPGSRQQASAVCVQLKANGYANCWVTTY